MCLSCGHCAHQRCRHVGMIVNCDVVARDNARQLVAREGLAVDVDGGIVRAQDACPDGGKLVVTVDENSSHSIVPGGATARDGGTRNGRDKR